MRSKWAVLVILGSGNFIMVLDSTVMNVSIQRVIEDLDTKVSTMQLAIATYTLTTAALMLIGGSEITPFGLSVVPFLIAIGCCLLVAFAYWERHVIAQGRDALVELSMIRAPQLRAGLSSTIVMFLCLGGLFFVLPLYLQIVLGKDPLETGVDILPLSMAVFFVAMGASRLSSRISPRLLVRVGLLAVAAGALALLTAIEASFDSLRFAAAVFVIGVGLGLLTTTFDHRVESNEALPYGPRHEVAAKTERGLAFVPAQAAGATLHEKGVPAEIVEQLEADYSQSQIDALKIAVAGVAAIALLGLGATRRLPANSLRGPPTVTST